MEFIILNTKVKENDVTQKALIYTGNLLTTTYAKTAHGLIRGSKRFEAVAIRKPQNSCNSITFVRFL